MRRAALLLVLAVLCGSACAQPVVNVYSSMAEKDLREKIFKRADMIRSRLASADKRTVAVQDA